MRSRRSIRRLLHSRSGGFSLIELLVTMFISAVMMTLMTGFFKANVKVRHDTGLQTEAQQGLRALFEMVTQELRQAGACLPTQGQFIALEGTNGGDEDVLTLRIGQTDPTTLRCIKASTAASVVGSSTLPLSSGEGDSFSEVSIVYITTNGGSGDFYQVVSTTSDSITIDESGDFPVSTGVYAIDERTYQVETMNGRSVLSLQIDGSDSYALVDGVEQFDVTYWLESEDDPNVLESSPLPETEEDWQLVRRLSIAATVEGRHYTQDGETVQETGNIEVKPRNLL